MDKIRIKPFRETLLRWYDASKRDLPWRKDREPYRVWVSEVMLQQTRVSVVVEYYERFLRRFPDIGTLARARESTVLALWSGLGYYRRARALQTAARIITRESDGRFPRTEREWRQLPGIGRYTAAAISSIAFGEPCAVVDGNVDRVLRRITGSELSGESTWKAAQELLSPTRPGDFNQALMELGATLCVPEQPRCSECPVSAWCVTRGTLGRKQSAERKRKELAYLLTVRSGTVYLVKRAAGSLMPGMWELPAAPMTAGQHESAMRLRHSITNTDYAVLVLRGDCKEQPEGQWIAVKRLTSVPLTGLARKILRRAGVI